MPVDLRDLFYMWKRQTGKAQKNENELLRNVECPKHININKKKSPLLCLFGKSVYHNSHFYIYLFTSIHGPHKEKSKEVTEVKEKCLCYDLLFEVCLGIIIITQ